MQSLPSVVALLTFSASLIGCGADSKDIRVGDGGVCGMITECGGDVVGTWEIESICFDNLDALLTQNLETQAASLGGTDTDLRAIAAECPGTLKSADVNASGTYRFDKSGDVTIDFRYSIDFDALLSIPCLRAQAVPWPGGNLEACSQFQENVTIDDRVRAPCQLNDGCACQISTREETIMERGRYRMLDNTLEQANQASPYCVHGDELQIQRTSAGTTGTLTFRRK